MKEGESGPHIPLPGQQGMVEAGGATRGLEAEDGEGSRARGRTGIPTAADGYSPSPERSETCLSSSESD